MATPWRLTVPPSAGSASAAAGDDALDLALKLAFSQRRLEESEGLALRLRESLADLVEAREALAARCATLKQVQEALLADKLTAERRVLQLTREKGELAAEARVTRSRPNAAQRRDVTHGTRSARVRTGLALLRA